jgi:hypothetical protein
MFNVILSYFIPFITDIAVAVTVTVASYCRAGFVYALYVVFNTDFALPHLLLASIFRIISGFLIFFNCLLYVHFPSKYIPNDPCCEKYFELSVVEIVEFKWLLICIYRSSHSDVHIFLDKLETLFDRVHKKKKNL